MKRFRLYLLSVAFIMASTCTPYVAPVDEEANNLVYLGSRGADVSGDKDKIDVGSDMGRFGAIQFRVHGGVLEMYQMQVRLCNGQQIKIPLRHRFAPGSSSREIDLPGEKRCIASVIFNYRTLGGFLTKEATVMLFGIRDRYRSVPKPHAGEFLGSNLVDRYADRDVIQVQSEKRFKNIRIAVYGGDVEIYDMKVFFRNGQVYHVPLRPVFRNGQHSRVIDLPGESRSIDKMVFFYRVLSDWHGKKARVLVFGQR